jgi:hypothetical protein
MRGRDVQADLLRPGGIERIHRVELQGDLATADPASLVDMVRH